MANNIPFVPTFRKEPAMVDITTTDDEVEEIEYIYVRRATPADFDHIREVAFLSRKSAFGHFMDDDEIEAEVDKYYNDNVLHSILDNPDNAIFVAERGDKALGHCCVLPSDRKGRPRLLQFYVRPDQQRQGVGELLFEHACLFLRQAGKHDMFVSTVGANIIGRKFFEKKGCRLIYDYTSIWDGKAYEVAVYYLHLDQERNRNKIAHKHPNNKLF
jgi:GNAT superfamily N-acetyltransferase